MYKFIQLVFIVVLLLATQGLVGQTDISTDELERRVRANHDKFSYAGDSAFAEIPELLDLAQQSGNREAELLLLTSRCKYYYQKMEMDRMLDASNLLFERASEFNNPRYQGLASGYRMRVFIYNKLEPRATEAYKTAIKYLGKLPENDPDVIAAKANTHVSYANMFLNKKDFENGVFYMQAARVEYDKLEKQDLWDKTHYWIYSSIAAAYLDYNTDSAESYVQKSLMLAPDLHANETFMYQNRLILGGLHYRRFELDEAITQYKMAEAIADNIGFNFNKADLYKEFINAYSMMKDTVNLTLYSAKANLYKLESTENKNRSLHQIIDENSQSTKQKNVLLVVISVISILVVVLLVYVLRKQKRKGRLKDYIELIEAARNNDPAFMIAFEEVFPRFSERLLKINPELTQYELEFCALLKMNIPTKEISKIKFLQPKTVHNRKSNIRKRLNIAPEEDIYQWFADF